MRVGIAGQEADQLAPIEPPRVERDAAGSVADERGHFVVAGVVFVIAGSAAEKLAELFEVNLGAAREAVESLDEKRTSLDTFDGPDFKLDDPIVRQERAAGFCGDVFVFYNV